MKSNRRLGQVYVDDDKVFRMNSLARFERRKRIKNWRVRILFAVLCVSLGAAFMWSV